MCFHGAQTYFEQLDLSEDGLITRAEFARCLGLSGHA